MKRLRNLNLLKNLFIHWTQQQKHILIFSWISALTLALISVGIYLTVANHQTYMQFVSAHAHTKTTTQVNIAPFIYGLFTLVMGLLLFVLLIMIANSWFNPKLNIQDRLLIKRTPINQPKRAKWWQWGKKTH